MAEYEPNCGGSDDWYTPPEMLTALGLTYDLDPCSPGPHHWVPAHAVFTKEDDGLSRDWFGLIFMNPPFGGRNGHVPWLQKFLHHGNGIAIVRAYTSSEWFHDIVVPRAETLLFPKGKTQFIPHEATRLRLEQKALAKKKVWRNSPGHGVVLIGMGDASARALRDSGLGFFIDQRDTPASSCSTDK